MRPRSVCLAALLATCLAHPAAATVLMDEPFTYSTGGLANNSSGVWSAYASPGVSAILVSNNAAVLSHGSNREDVLRPFNPANPADVTQGTLYVSFSLKVTAAPTTPPTPISEFFFGVFPAASIADGRGLVFLSSPAAAGASRFRLGLSNEATSNSLFTGDLTVGTQYQALMSIDLATNTSKLWVGTDLNSFVESSPTLADSVAVNSVVGFARVFLRQGNRITVTNSTTVDTMRAATSFSDLVTAIPEASAGLFCGLGGMFLAAGAGLRRAL